MKRDILGYIEYKRRFPHGRAGRYQNQIRGLQPRSPVIKVDKSGGDTRHSAGISGRILYFLQRIHNHLADRHKITAAAARREKLEYFLLHDVHDRVDALSANIAFIRNLFHETDQFPAHGMIFHNLRIVFYVCRSRHSRQQIPHKLKARDLWRHILFFQLILECHQIHRHPLIVKLNHGVEQNPVLLIVKIFREKHFHRRHNRILIHNHGTDDRLLCFQAVWHDAFYQRLFHK